MEAGITCRCYYNEGDCPVCDGPAGPPDEQQAHQD